MQHSILTTERLFIRPFTEDDADALLILLSDRETNRFLPWYPLQTLAEAKQFLAARLLPDEQKPGSHRYAICLKTDGVPIGYVKTSDDDSRDFGYGLRREFWRMGIVTEACLAVVELLRRSGIPYITATHDVNNPGSGEVMRKIGMSYRYSYEELWQPKNIPVTFRMYQLNFDGNDGRVYRKYWNHYPVHFVEENLR